MTNRRKGRGRKISKENLRLGEDKKKGKIGLIRTWLG